MTPDTSRLPAVLLAGLLALSAVAGAVAFAGTAGASLSVATADDVLAGLPDAEQTVTISGQTPANGDVDQYVLHVGPLVSTGTEVLGAEFENTGDDGDHVLENGTATFHPGNDTVTLLVAEDGADLDTKVDFRVTLHLDTSNAVAAGELRYDVVQYDSPSSREKLSPQTAQFDLIGSKPMTAATSDEVAGASPVTHEATMDLAERVRHVRVIHLNTTGADYRTLTAADVTLTLNGGQDLVTADTASVQANPEGDGLLVRLATPITFYPGDRVRLAVHGAANPPSRATMTVSFWTDPQTPLYAGSDTLDVRVVCGSPTPTASPAPGTPYPGAPGTMPIVGVGGGAVALVGAAYLLGRARG